MTPALAVIEKLPKDAEVVYVGRKYPLEGDSAVSLEYQTMNERKIPFIEFHPARLQRKFTRHTFLSLRRLPKGMMEAFNILRHEKPDVILSFGGYVAFPFAVAGSVLRIPVVTHEQTLEAGGTNKLIGKFATKICVSFPSSIPFFPKKKTILTGNPVVSDSPSEEIKKLFSTVNTKYPVITITGGSLGSHAINMLVEPMLAKLLAKYNVIHQTGDAQEFGDFSLLENVRNSLPFTFQERYILTKFISPSDIAYVYKHSDMVVSRSGANTVLTLLLEDIPAILIPLPHSQRQEQMKNALLLKESGLGEVLLQDTITSESLLKAIEMMMEKKDAFHNKDISAMRELHANAAQKIIQVVYDTSSSRLQKKT